MDRQFQQRLATEAQARTQDQDEVVSHYIICLQAIMRKQVPIPDIYQQLDLLYQNLLPEVQQMVRREEIGSVEGVLDRATEAELALAAAKSYKPPPDAETNLLPEHAYQKDAAKVGATTVAPASPTASTAPIAPPSDNIMELVRQMMADLKELKAASAKSLSTPGNQGTPARQAAPSGSTPSGNYKPRYNRSQI